MGIRPFGSMDLPNLRLIGTSHIAAQSLDEVREALSEKPDIVAIELDPGRLRGLMQKGREKTRLSDVLKIGVKGYLFACLGGWAERKMGNLVGVEPGSEMRIAVRLAKQHRARVALIDQPIAITLQRFSKAITWKEKMRFLGDILKGLLGRSELAFDLKTVPNDDMIAKLLLKVKVRYPNVYRVLITERNAVMAHNLQKLMGENPGKTIVAVVGAGHREGILAILGAAGHGASYAYSYQIDENAS